MGIRYVRGDNITATYVENAIATASGVISHYVDVRDALEADLTYVDYKLTTTSGDLALQLPPLPSDDGALLVGLDGVWAEGITQDIKVNTVEAAGQASAASVLTGALSATSSGGSQGTDMLPESVSTSDLGVYGGLGGAIGQTATTLFSRKGVEQVEIDHEVIKALSNSTISGTDRVAKVSEIPLTSAYISPARLTTVSGDIVTTASGISDYAVKTKTFAYTAATPNQTVISLDAGFVLDKIMVGVTVTGGYCTLGNYVGPSSGLVNWDYVPSNSTLYPTAWNEVTVGHLVLSWPEAIYFTNYFSGAAAGQIIFYYYKQRTL